ncbi:xanthine dehydrogenase family protein molybdopterin-binding subunit [SAR202 cluster bacterium AC-647-N09_OGT_505m]|nr:xanthine dehydrogenase family protein molybdopterin-binding subunit [SAR202 cluster bacterium AC-647-N09_OGT_505m]
MAISTDRGTATPDQFKVLGTRATRLDGLDKVTGDAKFGADIHLAGMLHGKILTSPHSHARIRFIDTSKAEAVPGVKAVVTAKDFPIFKQQQSIDFFAEQFRGSRIMAEHFLAHDKVLFVGHPVAAVAAINPHIAEEAAKLIQVEYEILPAVLTIQDALKENAPLVHDNLTTVLRGGPAGKEDSGKKSNVAAHAQLRRGDLESGFKEAEVIVEREFSTQAVHPGYIEPFSSTAQWNRDGHVTIWTTTQGTFDVREGTASILDIPESMLKVIAMECGGGFGGKGPNTNPLNPMAAILSKKSGLPVKMVMSRKETFESTCPASATIIRLKMGADKGGKITAAQFYLAYQAGAFPGSPVGAGVQNGLATYKIDNFEVDGYDVVTNTQKMQSYRAPGQPPATFAVEGVIDELAEKLGIDPMEFRLMNTVEEGDRMPNGVQYPLIACEEMEKAMKAHPHYNAPIDGPNQGRGVSVAARAIGGEGATPHVATISVNTNGTISLMTGSNDLSGTRTTVAMQAAEILGLEVEDVISTTGDTDSAGWSGVANGSKITYSTGLAAIAAAEEVKLQMSARAALIWEVQPEDVEFKDGVFACTRNPADRIIFKELAGRLMRTGGPITCTGYSFPTGPGGVIFGGNIVDVEVDPETGKVGILRYTTFTDVGRAVHPSFVEGQAQGSTAQGVGWALNEEYFYTQDGTIANSTFLDYRMPTSLDLPMIDTVIVEVPNPGHPFGLRGRAGEIPIVPVIAAVANAVSNATGVRMTKAPMTPGTIMEALEEKNTES